MPTVACYSSAGQRAMADLLLEPGQGPERAGEGLSFLEGSGHLLQSCDVPRDLDLPEPEAP